MIFSAIIIFLIFVLILGAVVIKDILDAKKQQRKYNIKRTLTAVLLLLPACVLAFFFVLLPILYSLGYAFTDFELLDPLIGRDPQVVWFDNFAKAFSEIAKGGKLLTAIKNTGIFVILVVPLQILLALGLALFCNTKFKGSAFFKVCFFTPVVISLSVTAYLWKVILSPSETGLMNSLLGLFNIPKQDFINNENTTMIWIVILSAWQGCGYQMLIFLSALTGIRKDLYEAARMDGCNAWHRFLKVTIPGLKPTLLYILITVFIGASRIMVQPMLMVGYQDNSVTLSYYMYQQGFEYQHVGYSSAIALLMTIVIGGITLIQRKFLGDKK